jgi:predicted transcriptional regulator
MIKLEAGNLNRFNKIIEISNLKPLYCTENETLKSVITKAISLNHRKLPVLSKDKKLIGIVTYTDMLDALLRNQKSDTEISNVMTRNLISSNSDDSIGYAFQKLKMSRRGGLPIINKSSKLVGIVTERDFVKRFSNVDFGLKISDIMTSKPFFISKNFSMLNALKSFVNTKYRRLPVVENNTLIGIVTSYDILRYLHSHDYNFSTLEEPIQFSMRSDVYTISKNRDISEAIKIMKNNDVGGIVVEENKKIEGILTERDILEEIM